MKMKRKMMIGLLLFSNAFGAPVFWNQPKLKDEQMKLAYQRFVLQLYQELSRREGNLFVSPLSLSMVLSLAAGGAHGETQDQMLKALSGLSGTGKSMDMCQSTEWHGFYKALRKSLQDLQGRGGVNLEMAQSLWPSEQADIKAAYLKLAQEYYVAKIKGLNYEQPVSAAARINEWVDDLTHGKIKDLINPQTLNKLTRLIMTNVIYFKGEWSSEFDKKETKKRSFYLNAKKNIKVPTMYQEGDFRYYEDHRWQLLEMPYRGHQVSMVIVLPRKRTGIADVEKDLGELQACMDNMSRRKIRTFIPRFKMEDTLNLKGTLAQLGMQDAFNSVRADFSTMSEEPLYIDQVIQKTFVEVNEEGTEAAAATSMEMITLSIDFNPPKPVLFKADHPFLFFIRTRIDQTTLFMGRLVDPR